MLFWNPGCGFCQRMVDDLKSWENNKPEGAPNLLVVSTGEVEANKATGLQSPIVLDSGFNVGRTFGASGTPSAVLVGADGKIASGLAVGSPSVISLLRNEAPHLLDASNAAPELEAPPAPRGVAVGSKAPETSCLIWTATRSRWTMSATALQSCCSGILDAASASAWSQS